MVKREKAANLGKVLTPKGLRARRLRLSAHTAIEFYDIQDRLGFDRSTEAIDWLIQNAKSSIDALSVKEAEPEVVKKQGLNDFQGQGLIFPSMANSQLQNLNYNYHKAVSNDSNADFSGLIFNATQNEMPLFNSYHHQQQQQHSNNGNGFPSFPIWE